MHHDDDHEEVDDFFDGPKTFVYNIFKNRKHQIKLILKLDYMIKVLKYNKDLLLDNRKIR